MSSCEITPLTCFLLYPPLPLFPSLSQRKNDHIYTPEPERRTRTVGDGDGVKQQLLTSPRTRRVSQQYCTAVCLKPALAPIAACSLSLKVKVEVDDSP